MALEPLIVYAKARLITTDIGIEVVGKYYTMTTVDGIDNFTPLRPRRDIYKHWTDEEVNDAEANLNFTSTGYIEKFKELGIKALKNAIVTSGGFNTSNSDWEYYTPNQQ